MNQEICICLNLPGEMAVCRFMVIDGLFSLLRGAVLPSTWRSVPRRDGQAVLLDTASVSVRLAISEMSTDMIAEEEEFL